MTYMTMCSSKTCPSRDKCHRNPESGVHVVGSRQDIKKYRWSMALGKCFDYIGDKYQAFNKDENITLDHWIDFEINLMRRFRAWYEDESAKDPEVFPKTTTAGEWGDQLNAFANGTVNPTNV